MKFKKIIFAFIALIVLGSGAVYLSAADMSDFDRISPFDVRSLWLMRQVRYIIESYQVDAETKPASEEDLLHGAMRGMVAAW
ncbi:MAG: S41 family peptidase, partial [Synergistaceae bacterium]|nr:S41 family peptidase [Synergistaceae bacterium]